MIPLQLVVFDLGKMIVIMLALAHGTIHCSADFLDQ